MFETDITFRDVPLDKVAALATAAQAILTPPPPVVVDPPPPVVVDPPPPPVVEFPNDPVPAVPPIPFALPAGLRSVLGSEFDFQNQPPGAVWDSTIQQSTPEPLWISANERNGSSEFVKMPSGRQVLELAIQNYQTVGVQTGVRVTPAKSNYSRFSELNPDKNYRLLGKEVWMLWPTFVPRVVPVEQEAEAFCSLGHEFKLNELGIVATNYEVIDGQPYRWLQHNVTGVSHRRWFEKERKPLPTGRWYWSALNFLATDDPAKGWLKWYIDGFDNVLEADGLPLIGHRGGWGWFNCFYIGSHASSFRTNERYNVFFDTPRVYVAA